MNKLFTKIAALSVGLTLAVGVGVAVNQKDSVKAKAAEVTIEKTATQIVSENSYTVSAGSSVVCYTSFSLDSVITISTSGQANCGSFWGATTQEWRLYQNKSGDVTVSAAEGYTIKTVTYTFTVTNTGVLKDGSTTVTSGSAVSVNASTKTMTVENSSTATNGQVRITGFSVVYEGSSDPGLDNMEIWDSSWKVTENTAYRFSSSVGIYQFRAFEEGATEVEEASRVRVETATWASNNTAVATFTSSNGIGYMTCVKPGVITISAEASGYNTASIEIEIIAGDLEGISLSGSMSKTTYSTSESWSHEGFSVIATYEYWSGDITTDKAEDIEWSYSPVSPTVETTYVVVTASYGGFAASSSAQEVTVTTPKGTLENPYSVAEARAAIDAGTGVTGVYATGIISEIVTAYSTTYHNITFNITADGAVSSTVFLQAYRCVGGAYTIDDASDIVVGATVIVYGNLKVYKTTYEFDTGCSVESYQEPEGTKYSVIDRVDYGILDKTEIVEGQTLNVSIVPDSGYFYPESLTYVYMSGSPVAYTYQNGVVTVANVSGNITIEGVCETCSPLKSNLGLPNAHAVYEFYGYFVGVSEGNGPIVMDGVDGIMLYKTTKGEGWVEGETILHVTAGEISIYNGLYEIKSATVESVSSAGYSINKPVTHIYTGTETAIQGNRLSNATGYVASVTKGDFSATVGSADIEFTFQAGLNNFKVYYKAAAQTSEITSVLSDSLTNSTQITMKGFTSWYNAFQFVVNGFVEEHAGYTAEDFAQDLLDQTDAVCEGWSEGQNNHDAIAAIWSDLASADKYPSLPQDQKDILAAADREGSSVVERAMMRYDFLTGKYSLGNFIEGRTPIVPASSIVNYDNAVADNNMMIIAIIAAVSAVAFATLLIVKKKRHN